MDKHLQSMFDKHDAILREERRNLFLFRVLAVVGFVLATLAAIGGWL